MKVIDYYEKIMASDINHAIHICSHDRHYLLGFVNPVYTITKLAEKLKNAEVIAHYKQGNALYLLIDDDALAS